jgi:hypothetical protein
MRDFLPGGQHTVYFSLTQDFVYIPYSKAGLYTQPRARRDRWAGPNPPNLKASLQAARRGNRNGNFTTG